MRIKPHLEAIRILKDHGVTGAGVIRAYHQRWVVSLMARALLLHRMAPDAPRVGTVHTEALITPSEIAQRISAAMDSQSVPQGVRPQSACW